MSERDPAGSEPVSRPRPGVTPPHLVAPDGARPPRPRHAAAELSGLDHARPTSADTDGVAADSTPRDGFASHDVVMVNDPEPGGAESGSAESGSAEPSGTEPSGTEPSDAAPDAGPPTDDASTDQGRPRGRRRRSRERRRKPARPWWIELPAIVVIAFALTFVIQTFIARVYYVPSGSMEHTLHGTTHGGDRILAYKLLYDFRGPRQGEVVVFKGPATWTPEAEIPGPSTWIGQVGQALGSVVGIAPPNEKDFVKRVIAVGGQTVSCCDAQGRVQVDGASLTEPYIFMDADKPEWAWIDGVSSCATDPTDPGRYQDFRCFGPYKVPQGMVWVMGDHRSDSADSSYQCRGLVPAENVHCQGPIPVKDVIGKAVFIVMPPSRWGTVGSPDIMPHGSG